MKLTTKMLKLFQLKWRMMKHRSWKTRIRRLFLLKWKVHIIRLLRSSEWARGSMLGGIPSTISRWRQLWIGLIARRWSIFQRTHFSTATSEASWMLTSKKLLQIASHKMIWTESTQSKHLENWSSVANLPLRWTKPAMITRPKQPRASSMCSLFLRVSKT